MILIHLFNRPKQRQKPQQIFHNHNLYQVKLLKKKIIKIILDEMGIDLMKILFFTKQPTKSKIIPNPNIKISPKFLTMIIMEKIDLFMKK